jgi:MarR family transcriptional regulator, organic hydroperoxide resistance regulator
VYTGAVNEFLTLFTRASKLLREAADVAMSQHGVRVGQNIILEVLWQQDGLTPGEIARRLDLSTPTVVNAATRMEDAGLLVRERDSADGRLVRLYLTPQARAVQGAIEQERSALELRATSTLTSQERRHLHSALAKIIDTLSQERIKH